MASQNTFLTYHLAILRNQFIPCTVEFYIAGASARKNKNTSTRLPPRIG